MDYNSDDILPLAFDYRVEEQHDNGCDWTIIVEAVITQEDRRNTISFSYTFSLEEFIADEPSPLKDELLFSFISGGISVATSLSYIYCTTMVTRDITSSPEYGRGNLLRFMYCLQSQPRTSIIEDYLDTGSGNSEENIHLNLAIHQSLQNDVEYFKPANQSIVNSLVVDTYSECHCGTISREGTHCVICLENFVVGGEVVKLFCGHSFDRECIVKWLKTSHYCPICRYQFPV